MYTVYNGDPGCSEMDELLASVYEVNMFIGEDFHAHSETWGTKSAVPQAFTLLPSCTTPLAFDFSLPLRPLILEKVS